MQFKWNPLSYPHYPSVSSTKSFHPHLGFPTCNRWADFVRCHLAGRSVVRSGPPFADGPTRHRWTESYCVSLWQKKWNARNSLVDSPPATYWSVEVNIRLERKMHENTWKNHILVKKTPSFLFHTTGTCTNSIKLWAWSQNDGWNPATNCWKSGPLLLRSKPHRRRQALANGIWNGIHAVFETLAVDTFTCLFLEIPYQSPDL